MLDTQAHKENGGARRSASGRMPLSVRIALSYSIFLLACLVLGVVLYASSTNNARESFWQQRRVDFIDSVETMDGYLAVMDGYTRQLLNDSTFLRFANMGGLNEYGYMTTAYNVKNKLSERYFSLTGLPINSSQIYLPKVEYVISGSQFTPAEQYYRSYRLFKGDTYAQWHEALLAATEEGYMFDMTPHMGMPGMMFIRDMNGILPRSVPAVIWFEWEFKSLQSLFLTPEMTARASLLVTDRNGRQQMHFMGEKADASLAQALEGLSFDNALGNARVRDMQVFCYASPANGWVYYLSMPESLCDAELGNYDIPFMLMLIFALLGGAVMVGTMVRHNMKPIEALGRQLRQAEGDRAQLEEQVEAQRPTICLAYVRKLLSGHIISSEEFDYSMQYLGINGENLSYFALTCMVYNHDELLDVTDVQEAMAHALPAYLDGEYPVYFYATLSNSYVVLVTYGPQTQDPLMDLQSRILALHDHLLVEHSLWFYAGVGEVCKAPLKLWESYEQSRTAARYTAKHHIFLPYEMIRKDDQSEYYPVELSAKLYHFITSGNRAQVQELMALIYRENINERTLPINRLNFLLSDLRNTLHKARFAIKERDGLPKEHLAQIDVWLNEHPTFPLCERIALEVCAFFQETESPGDPIPEVERYLRDNYTDPSMCLSKLSERFNISESYLSHLFKEKTGQNFSVYLENLRLEEAARRLQEDKQCPLQTLYLDLGYNNATTFRRAFKKHFGITPSAMREGQRNR